MFLGLFFVLLGVGIWRLTLSRSSSSNDSRFRAHIQALENKLLESYQNRELEAKILQDAINRESRAKAALETVLLKTRATKEQIQAVLDAVDGSQGTIDGDVSG